MSRSPGQKHESALGARRSRRDQRGNFKARGRKPPRAADEGPGLPGPASFRPSVFTFAVSLRRVPVAHSLEGPPVCPSGFVWRDP